MTIPKEFKEYEKKLKNLTDVQLKEVVAEAINSTATIAHIQSIRNTRARMTLRNKYTENSIRYYKANPTKAINRINAITGSISDYMDEQEAGGRRLPKQGSKAAQATLYARGGQAGKKKSRFSYLGQSGEAFRSMFFVGKPRGGGKNGSKPSGIYRRFKKKIRMTHNLEDAYVQIKATKWHSDAINGVKKDRMVQAFERELSRKLAEMGAK